MTVTTTTSTGTKRKVLTGTLQEVLDALDGISSGKILLVGTTSATAAYAVYDV